MIFKILKLKLLGLILLISISSCAKKIQLTSYLKDNHTWKMFGQSSERKFFVDDTLALPLKIDFITELKGGLNYSSVTTMDGSIFVGDLKGNLYKIEINSGQIKNYNNFKQPILTSIFVSENKLIFPIAANKDKKSYLIVYDMIKGSEISRILVEGSIEKEILPVNQDLFLTTTSGMVYKINKNYVQEWKLNLENLIYSHPAAGDDFIVTSTVDGVIFLISFDGKIIYRIKNENHIRSGFAIDGSRIYFGDDGGFVHCFDKNKKEFLFSRKLDVSIVSIPSIDDENLYIGDLTGNVYSVNKISGKVNWKKHFGGLINNSILIVGDKLVVPNVQKKILILRKTNGEVLQEINVEGRIKLSPVFVDNKLILGHDDKKIIVLTN